MTDDAPAGQTAFRVLNEISIIAQLTTTEAARTLAPELGVSELGVLTHFVRRGGSESPSRLARAFQVTKPSMTATLSKLEAKGYVAVAPHAEDKRQKVVTLTESGRQAHARAVARLAPALHRLEAAIGAEGLSALLPGLEALRVYLDAERNDRDGF